MNRPSLVLLILSAVTLVAGVALLSHAAAVIVASVILLVAGVANLETRDRK